MVWSLFGLKNAALAQSEVCTGDNRVDLVLVGPFEPAFAARVEVELRASVTAAGFTFCSRTPSATAESRPLAEMRLSTDAIVSTRVVIEVQDAVTDKRLVREVDLAVVPRDSRALALSVASDELLRASWIELSLHQQRQDGRRRASPPDSVQRVVEQSQPTLGFSVGTRFAITAFSGGEIQLGGELFSDVWLTNFLAIELAVILRAGAPTPSRHGQLESRFLGGSLGIVLVPVRLGPMRFGIGSVYELGELTFRGEPNSIGVGRTDSGIASTVSGYLVSIISIAPFSVRVDLAAGAVINSVGGLDDGSEQSAYDGLALSGRAGIALDL